MPDITCRREIDWKSYALSDVGCVRPVNEDAFTEMPEKQIWAVADGMGGHEIGDVASRKIIELLEAIEPAEKLSDIVDQVEDVLMHANHLLIDYAQQALNHQTMGTTVVCLIIKENVGIAIWAGDSRLYRKRNNQLQQLTRDHSQVEEMVQMGVISREEAETHPNKNVITRAIGVEQQLFVDINVFSSQVGDTFLLCSDGLYNSVAAAHMEAVLAQRDAEICVLELMKTALNNGAEDNVSLIVVKGEPGRFAPG